MESIRRRIEEAARQGGPPSRRSILIVEDQQEARLLMRYALRTAFRTDAVAGVADAQRCAQTASYDAFLIDITLGAGESGIALMEALQAMDRYAHTPMMAVTAHALPGDRQRFLDLGFDAYVPKPFAPAALRQQVKRLVATPTTSAPALG